MNARQLRYELPRRLVVLDRSGQFVRREFEAELRRLDQRINAAEQY